MSCAQIGARYVLVAPAVSVSDLSYAIWGFGVHRVTRGIIRLCAVFNSLRRSSCSSHFVAWSLSVCLSLLHPLRPTFGAVPPSLFTAQQASIEHVIDRAHELMGTPYKWGGTSVEQGFDCSSFLVYLFKTEANIQITAHDGGDAPIDATTIKRRCAQAWRCGVFQG